MFGNKKLFVLLALLVAILLVAACQQAAPTAAPEKEAATAAPAETVAETPAETEGPAPAAEEMRPYRFVAVVHGQASDPFWSVVKNGFDAAAKDMRVKVEYQAPGTFDMVEMSQLIDAAVASKPDGLIVSIPDPDALGESIRGAVDAGIPVFSINSGSDVAKSLGVIAHVGQTEYEAGYGGGQRMAAAGIKKAICVNQEVGNVALDLRCQGFADALAEHGIESSVIAVELADPTESQQRVMAALTSDPDVDGVLTLGPTGASPALKGLKDEDMLGKVKLATFDLSPEVLEAIRDGEMLFAIDQQQFTQGYLPIVYLVLYQENLNTPGSDVILTGPGFVTQETAAKVIEYSARGTR
ncbi:MAG TPA: sugar ABC transporter substrate-binding protein [Caldilineae bacterium]|nr:sugar ABC transporter substrate-binding protein [Caldilineae bacterium]